MISSPPTWALFDIKKYISCPKILFDLPRASITSYIMEAVKLHLRRACDSHHVKAVSQALHDSTFLQNPKAVVYGLLVLATLLWAAGVLVQRWKKSSAKASRSPSPDLEKPASRSKNGKERPFGGMSGQHDFRGLLLIFARAQYGYHPTSNDRLRIRIPTGV